MDAAIWGPLLGVSSALVAWASTIWINRQRSPAMTATLASASVGLIEALEQRLAHAEEEIEEMRNQHARDVSERNARIGALEVEVERLVKILKEANIPF